MSDTVPETAARYDVPVTPLLLPVPGLGLLGEAEAMACEGDVCGLPAQFEARVVAQRVDSDRA